MALFFSLLAHHIKSSSHSPDQVSPRWIVTRLVCLVPHAGPICMWLAECAQSPGTASLGIVGQMLANKLPQLVWHALGVQILLLAYPSES